MPAMLGEMLLKAGTLNEAQLEQVLSAQAVYGGRLGTNLVEMGLVGEDELARLLNEKLGVPFLDRAALEAIPGELLALIPLEMVRRYRVLPVAVKGKRLTVAMADPSDFNAIEEIGFVTGLIVVPRLCSELRLATALERYFSIARPVRYIPVTEAAKAPSAETAAPEKAGVESGTYHGEAVTPVAPLRMANGKKGLSVNGVAEKLAAASGEAEVVSALLGYLEGEFQRGAFLGLKRDLAHGARVIGVGTRGGFAGSVILLDDAEQLKSVVQERRLFIGELTAQGGDGRLINAMGVEAPAPALLLPLAVAGQVVAALCVHDRTEKLAAGVFELQRVAALAELALEMLCLRKRIKAG